MKNKVFSILLVVSCIFLAFIWHSEHEHRSRLNHVETLFDALQTRINMLELKVKALKVEIEMVRVSNHLKILKGWKERKKQGVNDESKHYRVFETKIPQKMVFRKRASI